MRKPSKTFGILLQPVSVEGSPGLNATADAAALSLRNVP
jgi:hypothetical protein